MVFKEVLHKDYLSYIVRHSLRQLKVVEFTKESLEELEEVQDALKRGNQTETLDAILADLVCS